MTVFLTRSVVTRRLSSHAGLALKYLSAPNALHRPITRWPHLDICRHVGLPFRCLPSCQPGTKHRTSTNRFIFHDISEPRTRETRGMQHALVFMFRSWKFSWWQVGHLGCNIRGAIACLVLFGFFTAASVVTARGRDGETPSPEIGNEIHSGSGIAGFEYQATPNYMFYGLYTGFRCMLP